jgi:hypothetical protein
VRVLKCPPGTMIASYDVTRLHASSSETMSRMRRLVADPAIPVFANPPYR